MKNSFRIITLLLKWFLGGKTKKKKEKSLTLLSSPLCQTAPIFNYAPKMSEKGALKLYISEGHKLTGGNFAAAPSSKKTRILMQMLAGRESLSRIVGKKRKRTLSSPLSLLLQSKPNPNPKVSSLSTPLFLSLSFFQYFFPLF